MKYFSIIASLFLLFSCKSDKSKKDIVSIAPQKNIKYAKGFSIEKQASGITILHITSP